MKKSYVMFLVFCIMLGGCGKKESFTEPGYVLQKWSKAIQNLDYDAYARCEAYPKSEEIFREMYRDYYFIDIMVTGMEDANEKDIRKDHDGNPFVFRSVSFEGSVVKRSTGKPYELLRGDAIFIRFIDGKRAKQGWIISNRTFVTIKR